MGYREPFTWYWLRRLVLNAVDGMLTCCAYACPVTNCCTGAGSEEVRNQIAGHLDSRTYRNNYQDQHISLDVANLVRGRQTEDTLMQKLNHAAADIDCGATFVLTPEAHQQIATLPDVIILEAECRRLAQPLRDQGGATRGVWPLDSLATQHIQARRKYRARKQFHRYRLLNKLRQDFFA